MIVIHVVYARHDSCTTTRLNTQPAFYCRATAFNTQEATIAGGWTSPGAPLHWTVGGATA